MFVFVPRGVWHAFSNPGPGRARVLVIGSSPVQALVEEIGGRQRQAFPTPKLSPQPMRASTLNSRRRFRPDLGLR